MLHWCFLFSFGSNRQENIRNLRMAQIFDVGLLAEKRSPAIVFGTYIYNLSHPDK